jgi:hypothetical protein
MFENATVTVSLKDFDELRKDQKSYRLLISGINECYEYIKEMNSYNHEKYNEHINVDISKLIEVTKDYFMDNDEIKIVWNAESMLEQYLNPVS